VQAASTANAAPVATHTVSESASGASAVHAPSAAAAVPAAARLVQAEPSCGSNAARVAAIAAPARIAAAAVGSFSASAMLADTNQPAAAVSSAMPTTGEAGDQRRSRVPSVTTIACTMPTTATPAMPTWVRPGSPSVRSNPVLEWRPSAAPTAIGKVSCAATTPIRAPDDGGARPPAPPQRRVAAPRAASNARPPLQNRRSPAPAPRASPNTAMSTSTMAAARHSTASPVALRPRRCSASPPNPATTVAASSTAAWPAGLSRPHPTAANTATAIARHNTPRPRSNAWVPRPLPPAGRPRSAAW